MALVATQMGSLEELAVVCYGKIEELGILRTAAALRSETGKALSSITLSGFTDALRDLLNK